MKIVITIEDQPGDAVKIVSTPSYKEMYEMVLNSQDNYTLGVGCAMFALRKILETTGNHKSKEEKRSGLITSIKDIM
jgi:hypothetical protein